jgi:hypothetical protein
LDGSEWRPQLVSPLVFPAPSEETIPKRRLLCLKTKAMGRGMWRRLVGRKVGKGRRMRSAMLPRDQLLMVAGA